ncbi:hypothetical protein P368_15605 [Comamonas thiooxydans]|nr:hypothetical protein P369_13915 [Comamonas thiooxydans]KGG98252.1 hypothetical protein P367_13265 [Comamonas thiooxydans]KGH03051.1 hypothetical protein P365_17530 [Comamonas thiooxydans]KGH10711.1 hypothetical protein P368_15605 [Comamonas thiooxydans]
MKMIKIRLSTIVFMFFSVAPTEKARAVFRIEPIAFTSARHLA